MVTNAGVTAVLYTHGMIIYGTHSRIWMRLSLLKLAVCTCPICCRHGGLYFVLWGIGRKAGSWNVQLYSVLPSLLVSKLKEVRILAVYYFSSWLALHLTSTQACFCKDIQHVFYKNLWCVYVLRGVRMWKSYAKSDLTGQTQIDFQKCSLKQIC